MLSLQKKKESTNLMPKNAEENTTTLPQIENKSTLKHVRLAASGSFILIVLIYKTFYQVSEVAQVIFHIRIWSFMLINV